MIEVDRARFLRGEGVKVSPGDFQARGGGRGLITQARIST